MVKTLLGHIAIIIGEIHEGFIQMQYVPSLPLISHPIESGDNNNIFAESIFDGIERIVAERNSTL